MSQIFEYRGVEGLVFAEVIKDDKEAYKAGEVTPLAGVAEIGKTTESSNEPHYYDNVAAIVINSQGSDEITISASGIPLDVLAKITGQDYIESTGAMVDGERQVKYFALGYITKKTTGEEVYVWRYKGTFGIPDSSHATENDGTDANGQELVYTGISTTHIFEETKKRAKGINVDLGVGKADVTKFFDEVTTPDKLTARTDG